MLTAKFDHKTLQSEDYALGQLDLIIELLFIHIKKLIRIQKFNVTIHIFIS